MRHEAEPSAAIRAAAQFWRIRDEEADYYVELEGDKRWGGL